MIAPKKFDLVCECLPYLIAVCIVMAGGPSMLAALLQQQSVPPDVALHFVSILPWWLPIVAAVVGGIAGIFLKMCYPGIQLPTTANLAQLESLVKDYVASHAAAPTAPERPPAVVPAAPTVPTPVNLQPAQTSETA